MKSPCKVAGCGRPVKGHGYCQAHLGRLRKTGSVGDKPIAVWKRVGCRLPGCGGVHKGLGYCGKHYQRLRNQGDVSEPVTRGRAGSYILKGYRVLYMPHHPNANMAGHIAEHRKVMVQMLGRPLLPNEIVHHRNGDKLDNRPENLELWSKSHPSGQRAEDLVTWAREMKRLYAAYEG